METEADKGKIDLDRRIGGPQDRTELRVGESDRLLSESLDRPDTFPASDSPIDNNVVEFALKQF